MIQITKSMRMRVMMKTCRSNSKTILVLALIAGLAFMLPSARADERRFTFTQEAPTAPKGAVELKNVHVKEQSPIRIGIA